MLSFIVLSSDGYSDCWNPFFELFEKHFPNIPNMELILSTNTKEYTHETLKIKVLAHGNDLPWSKRYKLCLEQAENEIVLPLSEDFFLKSKIDEKDFMTALYLILNEKEIDHIRLLNRGVFKTEKSNYNLLEKITLSTKKRFIFSPGLWKKKILNKYLVDFENPWIAEKMGDFRAKIYKDGFYCISEDYVKEKGQLYDTFFSGVIYKGKCAHYVVSFLEEEGYTDILKRGIMSKDDMIEVKKKAKRGLILSFFPIMRSLFGLISLYLKQRLKLN